MKKGLPSILVAALLLLLGSVSFAQKKEKEKADTSALFKGLKTIAGTTAQIFNYEVGHSIFSSPPIEYKPFAPSKIELRMSGDDRTDAWIKANSDTLHIVPGGRIRFVEVGGHVYRLVSELQPTLQISDEMKELFFGVPLNKVSPEYRPRNN